jgi:hypothetical protein
MGVLAPDIVSTVESLQPPSPNTFRLIHSFCPSPRTYKNDMVWWIFHIQIIPEPFPTIVPLS